MSCSDAEVGSERQNERCGRSKQSEGDTRKPWEVDYGRVIHSASFRRLQAKTQIFKLGDNDFYRTRLTHSLEVAQVADGVVSQLKRVLPKESPQRQHFPEQSQIQAIGLTHDLGHPPFGHGGEVALNYCMRGDGGFEGNAQTLRILSKLEKYSEKNGSDLTRRVLLGVLKYPISYTEAKNPNIIPSDGLASAAPLNLKEWHPPKCYFDEDKDVVDWILKPFSSNDQKHFREPKKCQGKHNQSQYKSLDCSIMDAADDISFSVHDLEDAAYLGLMNTASFRCHVSEDKCGEFLEKMSQQYPTEFKDKGYDRLSEMLFDEDERARKKIIGRLIGYFVRATSVENVVPPVFEDPLLKYRVTMGKDAQDLLGSLKTAVMKEVIQSPDVQQFEFKGQQMVMKVFDALTSDPQKLLPKTTQKKYKESGDSNRVICDHIAGMTDHFLCKTYERLYSPRAGSIFDKL